MSAQFLWIGPLLLLIGALVFFRVQAINQLAKLQPWACGLEESIQVRDAVLFTRRNFLRAPRGIPTLFIHGLGASSYCWRKVLTPFGDRREWIAVDLAGFGRSSKDPKSPYDLDSQAWRIIELMDRLSVAQAHVVGSSLGGALGLWLHQQHPKRFLTWIGVSPALSPALNPQTFLWQLGRRTVIPIQIIRALRLFINDQLIAVSLRWFRGTVAPLTQDERLRILGPYLDNGDSLVCFFKSLKLLTDRRLKWAWKEARGPLTIVWGQRDRMLPVSQIPKLVEGKKTELRILPRSAHHPMEDEPEAFLMVLREKIAATHEIALSQTRAHQSAIADFLPPDWGLRSSLIE